MATRTTAAEVRAVLPQEVSSDASMTAFIAPATALVDYVASKDSSSVLTSELLKQIETYLAAHFYALSDPQYQSKSVGKSSGVFQGQTGKRFDSTFWGQTAVAMDVTGCLDKLNSGAKQVGGVWLGKAPSDQTDYEDRD